MNLKTYLASINMTFKDFGENLEVSPRHLSNISKGRTSPSNRLAMAIQEATHGQVKFEMAKKNKKGQQQQQQEQSEQEHVN